MNKNKNKEENLTMSSKQCKHNLLIMKWKTFKQQIYIYQLTSSDTETIHFQTTWSPVQHTLNVSSHTSTASYHQRELATHQWCQHWYLRCLRPWCGWWRSLPDQPEPDSVLHHWESPDWNPLCPVCRATLSFNNKHTSPDCNPVCPMRRVILSFNNTHITR